MKQKIMFSAGMNPLHQKVLTGLLAFSERVSYKKVILVETEDPNVVGLLLSLDTAEQIVSWDAVEHALTPVIAPAQATVTWKPGAEKAVPAEIAKQKKDKRKYSSGELVECKVCHRQKPTAQLCKTGECKTCRMRELKTGKSQPAEKSHPHSALPPKPEFGHEDNLSNIRDRQKEKLDLSKLAGVKVG